jgi:exodeoxyribonuclease VII large subunit
VIIVAAVADRSKTWAFNEVCARNSQLSDSSHLGRVTKLILTIADFAADLRAATPSAAAEIVAAHEAELCSTGSFKRNPGPLNALSNCRCAHEVHELALSPAFDGHGASPSAANAIDAADYRMQTAMTWTAKLSSSPTAAAHSLSPARLRSIASAARARFESLNKARDAGINNRLKAARQQLGVAAAALDAMSPLKVLERGYAIAHTRQGQVVREASTMNAGD